MAASNSSQKAASRKRKLSITEASAIPYVKCVYDFFMEEKRSGKRQKVNNVTQRLAHCFGVSPGTVTNFRKVLAQLEDGRGPMQIEEVRKNKRNRQMEVPSHWAPHVRNAVAKCYAKKRYPTVRRVNKIMRNLRVNDEVMRLAHRPLIEGRWTYSKNTLWRYMRDVMGYEFGERESDKIPVREQAQVKLQRIAHLRAIKKYREMGCEIVYQDETWGNKNHTRARVWLSKNLPKFGLRGVDCPKPPSKPSGKGGRVIVCGCGSAKRGWIGEVLIFKGDKNNKDPDYHSEMNWEVFSDWFDGVLREVGERKEGEPPIVFIIDRAKYHTVESERTRLPEKMNKEPMAEWLVNHGEPRSKEELMQLYNAELKEL